MRGRSRNWMAAAVLACVSSCGEPPSPPNEDAGTPRPDATTTTVCQRGLDCDDGRYCNSVEVCRPGDPEADADGCIRFADGSACGDGETCDEAEDRCRRADCTTPDRDGDAVLHRDCVAPGERCDCDDDDGSRYPGGIEVCDAEGHDEDCLDDTWAGAADGDRDEDGFQSSQCCGPNGDGTIGCGPDCDDAASGVNPGTPE